MKKKELALLGSVINSPEGFKFLTQAEAISIGLNQEPRLVEANSQMVDPTDATKCAVRATEAGKQAFAASQSSGASTEGSAQPQFAILSGVVLPESKKRGGGAGAPTVYPFDQLEVGQTFFVPSTEKRPDPAKSLGSTISQMNLKYATQTGTEKRMVTKRGPKNTSVKGPDGKPVKEEKDMPVYKYNRRFTVRPVEAGKVYGNWTAPSNGAIVARVAVE